MIDGVWIILNIYCLLVGKWWLVGWCYIVDVFVNKLNNVVIGEFLVIVKLFMLLVNCKN